MKIFGAGMAGLLGAHHLRRFMPEIHEAQSSLPRNHAALLRFRSDEVSKVVNVPFKKVKVHKLIAHAGKIYDKPSLKLNNMYSQKVVGKIMGRSVDNLEPVDRFIAPDNFIEAMGAGLFIKYESPLTEEILQLAQTSVQFDENPEPIISTIPMPALMDLVGYPHKPEFNYKTIWSVWAKIKSPAINVYNTVYYPDYTDPYYRISITGDVVIAEYNEDPYKDGFSPQTDIEHCLAREFGIHTVELGDLHIKEQKYGKISPIDEKTRKSFILYMTDSFRIYSAGKFAIWKNILLDDVAKDYATIEKMIEDRDDYARKLPRRA